MIATLVVVAAALLMVRLGFWQLERRHEKEALLAHYAANVATSPAALVALWPVHESDLFRRVSAHCLTVVGWQAEAGRNRAGGSGWRHIASCSTGAEGPGFVVDMGISQSSASPGWKGGDVRGRLIWAPTGQPLVARLISAPVAPTPMIVSETAAPGLQPTADPDPASIPNNHLSYAVQWFLFAGIALVIYAIALWQRARKKA
ncbi:SURF1 family protein [Sphingomonas sp. MMS24-J13]|uniref:SURF1 family protein n=1 Tax=Sphingomonas sp. MMS24-J13 TaxID=3238686 RepID=UPI00384F1A3F